MGTNTGIIEGMEVDIKDNSNNNMITEISILKIEQEEANRNDWAEFI